MLSFLSGLFLLYEFRDTHTNLMLNLRLSRWLIIFIMITISLLYAGIKEKKNIVPAFCVFIASILWQIWMHVFIYGLGNFREITWGFLFMWLVWVLHDDDNYSESLRIPAVIAILFFSAFAFPGDAARDIFRLYSGAEDAAQIIETLPDDAVILENTEDFCNAVIPYLKTKTIYNPFSGQQASYINRNPKFRHSMSYDEFISLCRKIFPGKQNIWLLYCINSSHISGLEEHLADDNLYYSDSNRRTIRDEHFSIYRLNIKQEELQPDKIAENL